MNISAFDLLFERRRRERSVELERKGKEGKRDERSLPQEIDRHLPHHDLHHREVLEVPVRLEEGLAGEELNEDASDREHVAREGPSEA